MGSMDWQTNKTLSQCTKHLLENEIDYDVNFRIGEDPQNIKAHKLILRLRSPVFDRMFNGAFKESENDPVIPDVTPAAFRTLLRHCYYDCLDIEDDVALSVLYAADKYMLPLLEKAARKKLIHVMSGSNIWDIYKYALSVGDSEFDERCRMYFEGSISAVREALQTEAFLNIPHQVLLQFLHINDKVDKVLHSGKKIIPYQRSIGISISEIEIFKACNAWATVECQRQEIDPTGANKRKVMGECLFLIRFPTMLYKDLVNIVYPTGILSQTEKEDLCQYNHKEADSQCLVVFPSKERQFVVSTDEPSRLRVLKSTVFIESDVKVVLSRIWMTGFGMYRVTVRDEISDKCWSMRYTTECQNHCTIQIENRRTQLAFLDIEPRLLEPHTNYSVTAEKMTTLVHPDVKLISQWTIIGGPTPCEEVKITWNTDKGNDIYGLTLCLV